MCVVVSSTSRVVLFLLFCAICNHEHRHEKAIGHQVMPVLNNEQKGIINQIPSNASDD